MDTTFVPPNILGQAGLGQELAFNDQANPLRLQGLRQQIQLGQLDIQGQQAAMGMRNFLLSQIAQGQGAGAESVGPNSQPSATGGGGSSGGSVGSNPSQGVSPSTGHDGTGAPAPSSTQGGTAQSGVGNDYGVNFDPSRVAGVSPQVAQLAMMLDPKGIGSGIKEAQESAQKAAQLQAQGPLNFLDSIIGSQNPAAVLQANHGLLARWQQMAPQLGMNPDLTSYGSPDEANRAIRSVLGVQANGLRGQVGLPAKQYEQYGPVQVTPAGARYQTEAGTGKVNQISGADLKQVQGANGPVYATADQAVGKQPFNASIFGASNMSDSALQTAADYARTHDMHLPPGFSRNPLMVAQVFDRASKDMQASGDTVGSITARTAANKADTASLGNLTKLNDALTAYAGTLDKNIGILRDAFNKTDATGSPLINRAINAWKQGVSGDPDIAATVAALKAVQGEVAKIQSGSLGNAPVAEGMQKEIESMINKNMSPQGLNAALDVFVQEGKNRRESTQAQIDAIQQRISGRTPGGQPPSAPSAPSGQQTAAAPPPQLPDAARAQLKEGHQTKFSNGQTWELRNGQPVRIS